MKNIFNAISKNIENIHVLIAKVDKQDDERCGELFQKRVALEEFQLELFWLLLEIKENPGNIFALNMLIYMRTHIIGILCEYKVDEFERLLKKSDEIYRIVYNIF